MLTIYDMTHYVKETFYGKLIGYIHQHNRIHPARRGVSPVNMRPDNRQYNEGDISVPFICYMVNVTWSIFHSAYQ